MSKAEIRVEQGKRLRAARENAGYVTATEAAAYLGVEKDTYIQHENGTRGFKARAEDYAKKLRVSPEWLMWGRASDERMDRINSMLGQMKGDDRKLAEDLVIGTLENILKRTAS